MRLHELSTFNLISGPRGSGKTLLLTHFGVEAMTISKAVMGIRKSTNNPSAEPYAKVNIWANYPIRGKVMVPGYKQLQYIESMPLDVARLAQWKPEYHDGVILFDEIDQDADRQDWQSQIARFLTKGVRLMRHRRIVFICTLQFIDELNVRLYKQADTVMYCRDAVHSSWGRSVGLHPGQITNVVALDKSGITTGYGYNESGQSYYSKFFGERYWGNYSTLWI